MTNDATLGHVLAEARKKKGLSQKQLAEKIQREDTSASISPQYLNDIERDRRAPTSDHMIAQFAEALDLKADYLHYLNGRFPEKERQNKLTPQQFEKAMVAFRKSDGAQKKGTR